MSELDDILANMDQSLFERDEIDPIPDPENAEYEEESKTFYQEDISNEMARTLLQPKDYDPICHYQLITEQFAQYVIKIDERVSEEDEAEAVALDPETTKRHITEYPVAQSEVEDYKEIHDVVGAYTRTYSPEINPVIPKQYGTFDYRKVMYPLLLILFVVGCATIYYVMTL